MLDRIVEEYLRAFGIDGAHLLFQNTVSAYLVSLLTLVGALAVFAFVQHLFLIWLERAAVRTVTELDDVLLRMVRSFRPPFYAFLAFWLASQHLTLTGVALTLLNAILMVWVVYQAVIVAGIFIEDIVFKRLARDRDETTQNALRLLVGVGKAVMWIIGFMLVLSNLGVDITSLLAGAGIAGVAIAFALQGILGDLFSSFSLYFDKPFKVGDFIIVGTEMGTVKHIGVKSTRIQALSGEMLTISNKELTAARIQNFTLLEERRVVLHLGVRYDTTLDQVRAMPGWVKEVIEGVENLRFDRAHFKGFGDSSLLFEIVYFVTNADYALYMDAQQAVNLGVMERFAQEGVGFAFPTRTLRFDSSDVLRIRTSE